MSSDSRWTVVGLLALGMTVGCENPSDVGQQTQDPPIARAVVIGQPFSPLIPPDNGRISVNARSGGELLLSGKESDSNNAPILRYEWAPIDATTSALVPVEELIIRNSSTVALTVPQVRQTTPLLFGLTIYDANGRSARAEVAVSVEPITDPNRFLAFARDPRQFHVYTRLQSAPAPGATDARFSVQAEHTVTYLDRSGLENSLVFVDQEPMEVTWPVGFGSDSCDPGEVGNPVLTFDIPSLNVHDIARKIQEMGQPRDRLIELRDIDEAEVTIKVTLTNLSGTPVLFCPGIGFLAAPGVGAEPAADSNLLTVAEEPALELGFELQEVLDHARAFTPNLDSWNSANAYYGTIDPNDRRTTLIDWLLVNGFDPRAADFGADAHAVYTNNYDLGFGRDMYVKRGECDDGTPAPEPGACDVASVVINYASTEAAAKKIAPIVAVAMEYTRPECANGQPSCLGGERFTKFYTYAPDLRGDFVQVLSVDLDGRGEKFLPQACVVCHGGRPASVDGNNVYGNNGDLNSGWLTWDLDSFLYSDTDPSFSGKDADSALRAQFTRSGQEEAFRRLNYYAWLTMHREGEPERYTRARELVGGWYGDADGDGLATPGTTWREHVPDGWQVGTGSPGNQAPSDAPAIYLDVFAQHCRACHVLHAPNTGGQFPMGSYEEFISISSNLDGVLQRGEMPMARLTMDRFWVTAQGAVGSPAVQLDNHLRGLGFDPPRGFHRPGSSPLVISGLPGTLDPGVNYRLSALSNEILAQPLDWILNKPPESGARLLFATGRTPILVGIDRKGSYRIELVAGDERFVAETRQRSDREIQLSAVGGQPIPVTIAAAIPATQTITWTGGDGLTCVSRASSDAPAVVEVQFDPDPLAANRTCAIDGVLTLIGRSLSAAPVAIRYTVTDSDGDSSDGFFLVETSADLTSRNASAYVETRRRLGGSGATAVRLKSVPTLPGADLTLLGDVVSRPVGVSDPVQIDLMAPLPAGVTRDGNFIRYLPPAARITRYRPNELPGSEVVMEAPIAAINYRACYEAQAENGACPGSIESRQIVIEVVARGAESPSWSGIYGLMNGTYDGVEREYCARCHLANSSYPQWMGTSATATAAQVFDSTCNHVADQVPDNDPGSGQRIVRPGNPGESPLWQKPQGEWRHQRTDDNGITLGTPNGPMALWNAIRDWILDGAYYTTERRPSGNIQKCPE